jgi:hypothetical protein
MWIPEIPTFQLLQWKVLTHNPDGVNVRSIIQRTNLFCTLMGCVTSPFPFNQLPSIPFCATNHGNLSITKPYATNLRTYPQRDWMP